MKRIFLPIFIAVVAVVGLSTGLAQAASTDAPLIAEAMPVSALLSPVQQVTETVDVTFVDVTARYEAGVGSVSVESDDHIMSVFWDCSGCTGGSYKSWRAVDYAISTTGIVSEFVVSVSQDTDNYIVRDWNDSSPENWPRPGVHSNYYINCEHLGNGIWRFSNLNPFFEPFDDNNVLDLRVDPHDADMFSAGVIWQIVSVNGISESADCVPIEDVSITGPITIAQGELGTFTAHPIPTAATPPISYTWNTQNTAPQPPGGETQPSENPQASTAPYFVFYGAIPGTYTVTVEAANCGGSVSDSVTVTVISSYVPPFSVVDCDFPTLFLECPVPQGDGIGDWIQWLWCNLAGWFEFFVGIWLYILCMLYRPFAIVGNGVGEIVYSLSTNLGQSIFNLALFFLNWFSQVGLFALMLVNEVPVCVSVTLSWIANWINISGPGLSAFIEMAVPETVVWLSSLLSWFATDFLTASFGAILEVLATVINNASDTTQFLLEQFAATVIDAVRMIGYVIVMVTFVLDLLTSLVIGLNDALASDTMPEMFEELTYFWRGLDFFEEVVGDSPLAILNMIALGLIGVTLTYWTIGQVAGMIDDMMQV